MPAVKMLPTGGEFSYRAKAWLPDEAEERNRTARVRSSCSEDIDMMVQTDYNELLALNGVQELGIRK
jgi:hypothetical protein